VRWWFKSPSRQQHCGTCRITCLWISSEAPGIAGWDAVGPSAVRFSPAQYGHGRSLARKCSNGAHFWTPLDFPELSFKWRARLSCPSPARIAASVRRGEGLPGIGRCWSAVQCTGRQLATARVAASQPWPSARLAVPADESIRSLEATATDQRFSVSRVHYATGVFGNGEPGPSTFA